MLTEGATAQVFAYGQTGSGKTFAMGTMGRQLSTSGESDGIISRSMRFIFEKLKDIKQRYDVSLKVCTTLCMFHSCDQMLLQLAIRVELCWQLCKAEPSG